MKYFNEADEIETKEDAIDFKISLLYDMRILKQKKEHMETPYGDPREDDVRCILNKCKTFDQMSYLLHDVIAGRMKLNDFIKSH